MDTQGAASQQRAAQPSTILCPRKWCWCWGKMKVCRGCILGGATSLRCETPGAEWSVDGQEQVKSLGMGCWVSPLPLKTSQPRVWCFRGTAGAPNCPCSGTLSVERGWRMDVLEKGKLRGVLGFIPCPGCRDRLERLDHPVLQLLPLRTVPGCVPRHLWEFPSQAFLVSVSSCWT